MKKDRRGHQRPQTLLQNVIGEVDKIHKETIARHAEEVRTRKMTSEKVRLGPRDRLTRLLIPCVVKELLTFRSNRNGLRPSPRKIAEACENGVKQICKTLALEPSQEDERKE